MPAPGAYLLLQLGTGDASVAEHDDGHFPVWRWSEWQGRDNIGIDIVAERHDGGLVGKCQECIGIALLSDLEAFPSV